MGHQNRPQRMRSGVVVQAGINTRRRDALPLMSPRKGPYRALVVNTRVRGEEGHLRNASVECDVILIHTQIALQNIPVLQKQHGVNNVHALWVPRPSTRLVSGEGELNLQRVLSRRGTFIGPATPLGDVDGDMVLLDFIEGQREWPIIIGALPHERSNRVLESGTGWREGSVTERGEMRRDEYYTSHYGTEVRINEQGDLLIDTVNAFDDPATEDNSVSGGQMRVRIKDGERLTIAIGDDEDVLEVFKDGAQLRVDIGEGADEQLALGNRLKTYIDNEIATKVNTFWSAVYAVHKHSSPAGGSTGTPDTPQTDTIAVLPDTALSDLAKTKKS